MTSDKLCDLILSNQSKDNQQGLRGTLNNDKSDS